MAAGEQTLGQVIKAMPPGVFKTLCKVLPSGSLQARKEATGQVRFFWRYSVGSMSERVALGLYDPKAPPKSLHSTIDGYSVLAAMRMAENYALNHEEYKRAGGGVTYKKLQRELEAHVEADRANKARQTLKHLLDDYCDNLKAMGRGSHSDARSIFKVHVFEPWPAIAAMPAKEVTPEQIADMMRRVIELGHARTANKLRSFLRAAYETAKSARTKPAVPVRFKAYEVVTNPAADTRPDEAANKADKNPLGVEEMRTYWKAIKVMPGFRGAVLRLHLLTGGQRIAQLVNLLTANITADEITIYDSKGRPGSPARAHVLPLTPAAAKALEECRPQGKWALSTDGGETHLAATTLSEWAGRSAAGIPDFQAKRIRSGVETVLAKQKVTAGDRGRLQSHGISGVQARHYDGHDYMDEKRNALETLYRILEEDPGSNVKELRKRA
jgi:integrase